MERISVKDPSLRFLKRPHPLFLTTAPELELVGSTEDHGRIALRWSLDRRRQRRQSEPLGALASGDSLLGGHRSARRRRQFERSFRRWPARKAQELAAAAARVQGGSPGLRPVLPRVLVDQQLLTSSLAHGSGVGLGCAASLGLHVLHCPLKVRPLLPPTRGVPVVGLRAITH